MDRLKGAGIQVFRTDECGTVIATSNGKDISFNVKPGTYNGAADKSNVAPAPSTNNQAAVEKTQVTPQPQPAQQQNSGVTVWLSATGDCYHSKNNCGKMNPNKARQVSLEEAKQGHSPCSKCHPPQ